MPLFLSNLTGLAGHGSPRSIVVTMMIVIAKRFLQCLAGGDASHDDHGADGDILKDHRQAFIFDIFRHRLGLGAEVLEAVCWRHVHKKSIALLKSLRNRLSAGYSVIARFRPAENKASPTATKWRLADALAESEHAQRAASGQAAGTVPANLCRA